MRGPSDPNRSGRRRPIPSAMAENARALAASGAWEAAAAAWSQFAEAEVEAGRTAEACQAWCLAADALRRDERPVAAAAALDRALADWDGSAARTGSMQQDAARAVRVGVLLDAGHVAAAVGAAQALADAPSSPGLQVLALDLLSGALLAAGRVEDSRAATQRLSAICPPAAAPAAWFREAIVWRMDGSLARARGHLHRVLEQAPAGAAWAGPRAAAQAELAEIDLLEGKALEAAAGFSAAEDGWGEAGRQSGAHRARAGRLLALAMANLRPDPAPLAEGIALAVGRGLPLLGTRLLATQGALLHHRGAPSGPAFAEAIAQAEGCGAPLLEGWARWLRFSVGIEAGDGARARVCLKDDAVMAPRVARMP